MQDSFNLGWKLVSVMRDLASPELLDTYSSERRAIAQDLIDFDREWATMFSARPKDVGVSDSEGVDPVEFQKYFMRKLRFTAGAETRYRPSIIYLSLPNWLLSAFTIVITSAMSKPTGFPIRNGDANPCPASAASVPKASRNRPPSSRACRHRSSVTRSGL